MKSTFWPLGLLVCGLIGSTGANAKENWWEMTVTHPQFAKRYLLTSGCTINLFKTEPKVELFAYDYDHPGGVLEQHVILSKDSQGTVHRQDYFRVGQDSVESADDISKPCWEGAQTLPAPLGEFFRDSPRPESK